jgi:folate-dependent phosphoribosylglycinamide formyltransferase PurN
MVNIGILGSGKGSNCRAILRSIRNGKLDAKATVVISDVLETPILEISGEFGVHNA